MITRAPTDTSNQAHSSLRGHFIAALLLAAGVFGTYYVCLTNRVAHIDDYWLLWEPANVLEVWNAAGRWASGLIFQTLWYEADSVNDLWRPRLASLIGIYLLAVGVYASLRRFEYSWLLALAVAALAALLPTFNVYAVWATCAGHVYACLAAMIAFWLVESSGRHDKAWQVGVLVLAAVGVQFVAFSIYQPAAMFYVTMVIMALAAGGDTARHTQEMRRWTVHAAVVVAAMGVSSLTFKLMARKVQNVDIAARAEFTSDLITKAGRFVLQPVGQSCVPYVFVNHWPKWQMLAVELAILGIYVPLGLWLRWGGSTKSRVLRIAVLLALIPATYLPNLVISSDFFPYRTRPAIAVAILFLLILATAGYLRRLVPREPTRHRMATIALVCAFVVGLVMARYHLRDYFFIPSQIEWDVVRAEVEHAIEQGPDEPRRVIFILPDPNEPVAPRFLYDEYGYMSAGRDWVTEGMTGLAVREIAPDRLPAFLGADFINIPREQPPLPPQPDEWQLNARRLNAISQHEASR